MEERMRFSALNTSTSYKLTRAEDSQGALQLVQAPRPGLMERLRKFVSSRTEGGALVEMALTMPLMFLIMTGVFSFSIAIYQKLELEEAVANGGRVLAVDRGDTDPCKTVSADIATAAPTLTSTGITYSFTINGGTPTGATCTGTKGASNMTTGGTASVTATYTCSIKAYNYNFPGCTLSSSITEVLQ
jgi:Flp pilus assembly protein TadG